jgi:tetrahydromethanopterin S-methyltransferase subunit G
MSTPLPDDRPPASPEPGSFARAAARDMRDSAVEALVGVVAVVVVAGGLGLLGAAIGGSIGFVIGAVIGLVLLGIVWVVLLATGAAAGLRRLTRRR